MFYNVPTRKKAFKNINEEYTRIVDVVNRYAVHSQGIGFSCKRYGENIHAVSTTSKHTLIDSIRQIYGTAIANELLSFATEDDSLKMKASGLVTNPNYHVKKMSLLLFINRELSDYSASC